MIEAGWVSIHRRLFKHPIIGKTPERLLTWIWMLASATHEETEQDVFGHTIKLTRGQLCASNAMICEATGISRQALRTFLDALEKATTISRDNAADLTKGRTIITICNYDEYQSSRPSQKPSSNQAATKQQPTKEQENNKQGSSNEELAREAFALFSAMAERIGCAVPAKFSDARKRSLLARLSECGGMDGWNVALGKVEASSFLRGSAWFGLDWMLKPSNFTKIMEGNYDDRDCASARGSNTGRSGPHDALMAGFARLANSDDGTGGDDFGGGETSYCAGPKEMDGWTGGDSSQPLLRLVGER